MQIVHLGKFYVMAGIEGFTKSSFELNAIDIPTMAEAKAEAARRNAVECANGKHNVLWFASEMFEVRP